MAVQVQKEKHKPMRPSRGRFSIAILVIALLMVGSSAIGASSIRSDSRAVTGLDLLRTDPSGSLKIADVQEEKKEIEPLNQTVTISDGKSFRQVEFSQVSEMQRFFIEGRIKLVYYLYALTLAIAGFFLTQFNGQRHAFSHYRPHRRAWILSRPDMSLPLLSMVFFMLGLLAFLVVATITNWNDALVRYGNWRESLLSAEYGNAIQEVRSKKFEAKQSLFGGDPSRLTLVPAYFVLVASFFAMVAMIVKSYRLTGLLFCKRTLIVAAFPVVLLLFIVFVFLIQRQT